MSVATSLSRQFDATREEIIASFRDRIANLKRSKLTKQELEELIDIFISRLQSTDDPELIQQLCEAEIALLEEGYSSASVAKNYLPKYRKAIATALDLQRINLNQHNSHSYSYFKDGAEHLTCEHWALTYLKYDRADYEQFAHATTRNNNLKQDSLQPVNRDLYLEAVHSLLESSQPFELAIAIAAVTGRRYSEVMARGHFEPTDHPYQISFSGQLKKRTAHAPDHGSKKRDSVDPDSYRIFALVPAPQVLAAIERFRIHPYIAALSDASIEEINQLNTPINRLVKHYFQDSDLIPVLNGEAGVTIQNLRGIYGEIAVSFFCPPNMGTHRFVQQKLGHLITDSQLQQRKNSGSTEHYFHYYLVDRDHRQLASKGVLLEQISLATTATTQEIQQLEIPHQEPEPQQSEAQSAPQEINPDLEPLPDSSSSISSPLQKTSHPEAEAPPETQPAPSLASPEVHPEPDFTYDYSPKTPVLTPTPEPPKPTTISADKSSFEANSTDFLACIRTLIKSDDYRHLLVGLMASTGLDAASLLKLLVFKQAAAPHLLLYCHQLHPPHQPLLQLLTLLNADDILDAIASLRRHRDAIDFAHRLTGEEINSQVHQFIPDVLSSVGLASNLNLTQQYQDLIPLLLKPDLSDNTLQSLSANTQTSFERWQHHFSTDADATLNELMRLASIALSFSNSGNSPSSRGRSPSSFSEPSPWLAISRLTDTVAHLTNRLLEQNQHLMNLRGSSTTPTPFNSPTPPYVPTPTDRAKTQTIPSTNTTSKGASTSDSVCTSSSAADLTALKSMSSEQLRASRAKGVPTEKLHRALDAAISYNQQQSEPQHMWRINPSILQQLTGCFNSYVKDFVRQHQSAIDSHNRQHGLTSVRHNSVHNGQDPNDFIKW